MVSIELLDIHLFGFHGLEEGEQKTGNEYVVNLVVSYVEGEESFESLKNTIDYVRLFEILKQRMHIPTPLLEKLADGIIRKIRHQFSFVSEIKLSIYKLQPPIENFQGRVGVTIHKRFNVQ